MNVMDRGFGHDATLDPESNCTLEMYAAGKALPVDFLRSLGLATTANPYAPRRLALAIPYRNADGNLHRKRLRSGLIRSKGGQDRRIRFGYRALAGLAFLVQPTSSQSAMTVTSKTVTSSSSWKATRAA